MLCREAEKVDWKQRRGERKIGKNSGYSTLQRDAKRAIGSELLRSILSRCNEKSGASNLEDNPKLDVQTYLKNNCFEARTWEWSSAKFFIEISCSSLQLLLTTAIAIKAFKKFLIKPRSHTCFPLPLFSTNENNPIINIKIIIIISVRK